MLKRPAENDAALQRFLRQVHTPGSSVFHQWVTPHAFGEQFGAKDEDIQTVAAWLRAHGFSVAHVTDSKTMIEFSGTAGQVREALHTEIHKYVAGDTNFYANDREISVPESIASRVRNFAPLNSYPATSYLANAGKAKVSRHTDGLTPQLTMTVNNAPFYALAPEDFATQYDLGPVYKAGTDGSGQTIGIIGVTNINLELVNAYRSFFNLPADHTQIVVDGEDPGDGIGPNVEAFLDVEASGAVAPNANINFYVASGQPAQNVLALAALRAIEDNQASVLSLSYGECEPLLGEAGNQLWAGLWEQAAAQGQTVLVASGDTGAAACLNIFRIGPNDTVQAFGLTANGFSSTPWNVSVGGTDFYYSDYASGGSSIASLWNETNDANLGSLKAPLPEQPWNDALGFNIVPYFTVLDGGAVVVSGPVPSAAGGGASSNCSSETAPPPPALPTCISGYSKPVWQQGAGVPNDGVRDLPDVSLFAANGPNLSAWPICAEPGDCVAGATSSVTLVGGTSSSTPAMAGIMALVNQQYGRQGQADYTLYALANQQPAVFHDITLGTNNILCMIGPATPPIPPIPNCTVPYSNPYFSNLFSFGVYAAGPGYDLATGLGSFDAGELISDWQKISLLPTTTTLQLSPPTITHGSPIAITSSVKATSGSATPTGDIVLETSPASAMRGNGVIALSSGTASANVTTLAGGTYQLVAQYGGDGVFGASTSTPVAVTVTPEPSTTVVKLFPPSLGQVAFGNLLIIEATPTGINTRSSGLATGSVAFTDGNASATVPLNVNGVATWKPQVVALGSHSVTASYSGDASYMPSTGGPLTFTVVKGTPFLQLDPLDQGPVSICPPTGGQCSQYYLAGSSLVVHVLLDAANPNVPPTGTVTVTLGGLTQTVPVVADSYINENLATAYVTLSNVPAGTYTLSASYSGDSNWNATSNTSPQQLVYVASSAVATSTTTMTVSPSSVDSSGSVTFNVTVTASTDQYGTPLGAVYLLGNGTVFGIGLLGSGVIVTQSATETSTITVPGIGLPSGNLSVVAAYSGWPGVASSVSAPVALNVTASDFTLSAGSTSVTVVSGKTGTVPVLLGGPYGTSVPVTLACVPSSSSLGCSVNPTSTSVNGSGAAALTITASIPSASPGTSAKVDHLNPSLWFGAGSSALAFGTMILFPFRKRRTRMQASLLLLFSVLIFATGCGGGSVQKTPNQTFTPAGSYSILVTATANGIAHNVSLTVIVSAE